MKKILNLIIALSIIYVSAINIAYAQRKGNENIVVENGIDRPGKDYKRIELNEPNVALCIEACKKDPKCKAFTYVKPGIQGAKAVCYLKNDLSTPIKNTNCISGIKQKIELIKVTKIETKPKINDNQVSSLPVPLPDPNKNPHEEAEGLPIPLPEPSEVLEKLAFFKTNLPSTRSEVISEAIKIDAIRNKLIDISNNKKRNLNSIKTITFLGNIALPNVTTTEIITTGEDTNTTTLNSENQYESIWSGGIQLTPNNLFSRNLTYTDNYEISSIAYISIRGIKTGWDKFNWQGIGLEAMANSNTVIMDNSLGEIEITLNMEEVLGLYLFELNLKPSISSQNPINLKLLNDTLYAEKNIELFPSTDNSKYFGMEYLGGWNYGQIKFNNTGPWVDEPEWYFGGITITKL